MNSSCEGLRGVIAAARAEVDRLMEYVGRSRHSWLQIILKAWEWIGEARQL